MMMALLAVVAQSWGQGAQPAPHVGYIYPAGGQRGTTFLVTLGGQYLRGVSAVYLTGEGVRAEVVQDYPPLRAIGKEEREALAARIRTVFAQRWEEMVARGEVSETAPGRALRRLGLARGRAAGTDNPEGVKLPEHPLLHELDDKSIPELLHAVNTLRSMLTGQRNLQLAATVLVRVTIDRDAPPGNRELRLQTRLGLTNPMCFQVGTLPESHEHEVGDVRVVEFLPTEPPLELPITINGQIMPGDADRFRFSARQGQGLVIEAQARQLVPYLADAVPGWFQATLALYDANDEELAFVDDFQFSPDPVFYCEIPADGVYTLEIRDAIYRGREDFVYRVSISERPYITSVYPLGCQAGQKRYVIAAGWNLYSDRFFIDGAAEAPGIRQKPLGRGAGTCNLVTYAVSALRARLENEDNDTPADAQRIGPPTIIDGRIDEPGDLDHYQFAGRRGDEIVVEVTARRARSPLDGLVRLLDEAGNVVAWNDDYAHKDGHLHMGMGDLTHHADPYLQATLPAKGTYCVQVSDTRSHGGAAYAYRLRVGLPQPDFELRVAPSSINVRAGLSAPLEVHALRRDGYTGPIEVALQDAPPGFALSGARIPAGQDRVRMTLDAPVRGLETPAVLVLEGRAKIDGRTVTRPVVPAEDMMQAFLYRHLTPVETMMVWVDGGRRGPRAFRLVGEGPVRIPAGSAAEVRVVTPRHPRIRQIEFGLVDPPAGVTLGDLQREDKAVVFELAATEATEVGLAGNLIVEASLQVTRTDREGTEHTRRVVVGVLPAIPFEVVPW